MSITRLVRAIKLIGAVILVTAILFSIYYVAINWPKAKSVQRQLINEFNLLPPPANASVLDFRSSHKLRQALVTADYKTSLSYEMVGNYYNEKLIENGWQFQREKKETYWGRDLGGKTLEYRKGKYIAELFFPGENSNYSYTYGFSVSWGLD